MELNLGYSELEAIVAKASQIDFKFRGVSADTLRVCYPLKLIGKSQDVGIDLRVTGITGNDVFVEFSAGNAMANMALNVAIGRFRDKLAGIADIFSGNRMTIHLDRIPKMSPILDKMQLTAISFMDDAASIVLDMR
ncbi:MAG: hypothetical protein J5732_00290 [Bacteroidaceae bacterium]|nr:hypothetical protein [Bacteroidaceae bacterium]